VPDFSDPEEAEVGGRYPQSTAEAQRTVNPIASDRRRLLLALSVGALTLPAARAVSAQDSPRLIAYLKVGIKVSTLESVLRAELPGVNITFMGRLRDFRNVVEARVAQLALAQLPVLQELSLAASLQGMKNGSKEESYVLVSTTRMSPSDAPHRVVGMVDLVGRRQAPELVAKMLGGYRPKKVERVTKEADLMGLLQFRVADAILVREASLDRLRRGSQMSLTTTSLPTAKLGLPAFWVSNDGLESKMKQRVKQFSPRLLEMLGVDGWR
jgi:hypothetical protein